MWLIALQLLFQQPPPPRVPPEALQGMSELEEGPRELPKLELPEGFKRVPTWKPHPVGLEWGYFRYRRFWLPLDVRDIPLEPPEPVHPPVR